MKMNENDKLNKKTLEAVCLALAMRTAVARMRDCPKSEKKLVVKSIIELLSSCSRSEDE